MYIDFKLLYLLIKRNISLIGNATKPHEEGNNRILLLVRGFKPEQQQQKGKNFISDGMKNCN